jgi:hypothetical protein
MTRPDYGDRMAFREGKEGMEREREKKVKICVTQWTALRLGKKTIFCFNNYFIFLTCQASFFG